MPVLPVARELFSKTKWIASKGAAHIDTPTPAKLLRTKAEGLDQSSNDSTRSHSHRRKQGSTPPSNLITAAESVLHDSGNLSDSDRDASPPKPRSRMFNILHQKTSLRPRTLTSEGSSDVRDSPLLLNKRSNFYNSPSRLVIVLTPSLLIRPPIGLGHESELWVLQNYILMSLMYI